MDETKTKECPCGRKLDMSFFVNIATGRETVNCKSCRERSRKQVRKTPLKDFYKQAKQNLPPCEICKDDDPEHKEFDHKDPATKICEVHRCRSIETMKVEIAKCRSLCRKCHAKRTAQEVKRGGKFRSNFQKNRDFVRNAKLRIGKCQADDCKDVFDPKNLSFYEWNHIRHEEKTESISAMIAHASMARLQNEVKKCELLCAYCHRKLTAKQREEIAKQNQTLTAPVVRKRTGRNAPATKLPKPTRIQKITGEQAQEIRQMWETGLFLKKDIAAKFNICGTYAGSIINHRVHREKDGKDYQGRKRKFAEIAE